MGALRVVTGAPSRVAANGCRRVGSGRSPCGCWRWSGPPRRTRCCETGTRPRTVSSNRPSRCGPAPPSNRRHVITGLVTGGDLGGQLADRCVEHGEVIGQRVRASAPRPQHRRECFAGRVREAEQRMEPEPALVVRTLLACSPSGSAPAMRRCPTPPSRSRSLTVALRVILVDTCWHATVRPHPFLTLRAGPVWWGELAVDPLRSCSGTSGRTSVEEMPCPLARTALISG